MVTLRFKESSDGKPGKVGVFYVKVQVDRGVDLVRKLWLSESEAKCGGEKVLSVRGRWGAWRQIMVNFPAETGYGYYARVAGLGKRLPWKWGMPFWRRKGDLLVRFEVFADQVTARYGALEGLSTEELALESWVYRRLAFLDGKLRDARFPKEIVVFSAVRAANAFNASGWKGIARELVKHFKLADFPVSFQQTRSITHPGQCERKIVSDGSGRRVASYQIQIREDFLENPFTVTAILAHELCHLIEAKYCSEDECAAAAKGPALLEMERTVDLLVFRFGCGEFQMRTARDSNRVLGYFNQVVFERMAVILRRKKKVTESRGWSCDYCGMENEESASTCARCGTERK